ncbi:UNKNOWN [Stylonychia lemnae]|uniref:IQ calmodulin-binding motif family protein n=1 Tax=Stylonychia lemnae TaxID=5949 RepID=A0A077ZYK0_STYLE|nr:UNKNOWN [Stylonychia lemnae]|eukprot:CDW74267.1 UNKNOWN [Stylonychia lemnae]
MASPMKIAPLTNNTNKEKYYTRNDRTQSNTYDNKKPLNESEPFMNLKLLIQKKNQDLLTRKSAQFVLPALKQSQQVPEKYLRSSCKVSQIKTNLLECIVLDQICQKAIQEAINSVGFSGQMFKDESIMSATRRIERLQQIKQKEERKIEKYKQRYNSFERKQNLIQTYQMSLNGIFYNLTQKLVSIPQNFNSRCSTSELHVKLATLYNKNKEIQAAMKIQCWFRMFLNRRKFRRLVKDRVISALCIQKMWKRYRLFTIIPNAMSINKVKSSSKVQKYLRGYLARRYVAELKQREKLKKNFQYFDNVRMNLETQLAIKILRRWRIYKLSKLSKNLALQKKNDDRLRMQKKLKSQSSRSNIRQESASHLSNHTHKPSSHNVQGSKNQGPSNTVMIKKNNNNSSQSSNSAVRQTMPVKFLFNSNSQITQNSNVISSSQTHTHPVSTIIATANSASQTIQSTLNKKVTQLMSNFTKIKVLEFQPTSNLSGQNRTNNANMLLAVPRESNINIANNTVVASNPDEERQRRDSGGKKGESLQKLSQESNQQHPPAVKEQSSDSSHEDHLDRNGSQDHNFLISDNDDSVRLIETDKKYSKYQLEQAAIKRTKLKERKVISVSKIQQDQSQSFFIESGEEGSRFDLLQTFTPDLDINKSLSNSPNKDNTQSYGQILSGINASYKIRVIDEKNNSKDSPPLAKKRTVQFR